MLAEEKVWKLSSLLLEGKLQGSFSIEEVVMMCVWPELPSQMKKWRPGEGSELARVAQ